jgi:hypothetical protein
MSARSARTIDELSPKYSIYLTTEEKKDTLKVNAYQGYIINMNDRLNHGYNEMKKELEETKLELDQRDDELGREEKSNTNLRGATHNINALNQLNQKIKNQYVKYQSNTIDLIKIRNNQLQTFVLNHFMFILISIFVCVILWYMNIIASDYVIFHIIWHIVDLATSLRAEHIRNIITKKYKNIKADSDFVFITNKYMPVIKQYTCDINKLVIANDYLSEYIDSL